MILAPPDMVAGIAGADGWVNTKAGAAAFFLAETTATAMIAPMNKNARPSSTYVHVQLPFSAVKLLENREKAPADRTSRTPVEGVDASGPKAAGGGGATAPALSGRRII